MTPNKQRSWNGWAAVHGRKLVYVARDRWLVVSQSVGHPVSKVIRIKVVEVCK